MSTDSTDSAAVLVAGASGVVGQAAVEHLAARGRDVVALSRRPPDLRAGLSARHVPVDLHDPAACAAAARALPPVGALVYAALQEQDSLVSGWRAREQMDANLAMLRHLMEALAAAGHPLRHVSLLQGTKAYGVHLHPIAVPARERWPRDAHENFYWLQEDYLREVAARRGFAFTIWRPQVIFGDVVGAAMNITPVLGAYAAICREQGVPFSYPGGPPYVLEAVDARLLARAFEWAIATPAAHGQTFNVTNGDVFVWQNVWPAIADALGVACGEPQRRSLAEWLPTQAAVWDRVVARHGLRPLALDALLGKSHQYADFTFATRSKSAAPPPALVSTVKLRQAGFGDCIDTEDMFRDWFRILADKRILPRLDSRSY